MSTTLTSEPQQAATPRRQYSASGWTSFQTLARAMLRSFFRDRMALFFTFFFPLMFLVVFGLVFNNQGSSPTTIGVVGDGALVQQLPSNVLEAKRYATLDAGIAAVRKGDVPAVVAQQGDRLVLRYAQSDPVKAATVQGILGAGRRPRERRGHRSAAEAHARRQPGRGRLAQADPVHHRRASCRGVSRRPRRSVRR